MPYFFCGKKVSKKAAGKRNTARFPGQLCGADVQSDLSIQNPKLYLEMVSR
jgi:hypothetical protein